MKTHSPRQSELCRSVCSPAKAGERDVWGTQNRQNWFTVRFSGRAKVKAGEFTPRRRSSAVTVRKMGVAPVSFAVARMPGIVYLYAGRLRRPCSRPLTSAEGPRVINRSSGGGSLQSHSMPHSRLRTFPSPAFDLEPRASHAVQSLFHTRREEAKWTWKPFSVL